MVQCRQLIFQLFTQLRTRSHLKGCFGSPFRVILALSKRNGATQ
ncbi:hypothetical protein VPHK567_0251 [Vibrio phage K567]